MLPLEVMPQKKSIFSESFSRRSSLTLASVPAFSSALRISILRLPRSPPGGVDLLRGEKLALVHRLAEHGGGPGEERHVADLDTAVSGMLPFGLSWAWGDADDRDSRPAVAPSRGAHADAESRQESRADSLRLPLVIPPLGGRLSGRGTSRAELNPLHARMSRNAVLLGRPVGCSVTYNRWPANSVPGRRNEWR